MSVNLNMNTMSDWQSDGFRQSMVKKLEDALRENAGYQQRDPAEMEQNLFNRCSSREEYLNMIARYILMVKGEKNVPQTQGMGQFQPQASQGLVQTMAGGMQGMQQQGMQGQQQMRIQQQQQQQMMQQMAMNQGAMRGPAVSQLQQRLTQQRMPNQMVLQNRPQMMGQGGMSTSNRMNMQMSSNMGIMNQGQMLGTQQRGPAPPYMNPSPGSMTQPGGSPMMLQQNIGLSPSMSNQFIQSPSSSQSGQPSPGPRSNLAPSPMSVSLATPQNDPPTVEDQAYLHKVRQLSRYIEPLRKMIAKIGNEDQDKLGKMKKLLDILSNPSKRMPMETLLKCETVLDRMNLDTSDHVDSKFTSTLTPPPISSSIMPLLEAIVKLKNNQKSSLPLNHALHRTFGMTVDTLLGGDITLPPLTKRRRGLDLEDLHSSLGCISVPQVLQGEVARLQSHFKVSLDPAQPLGTPQSSILLVCQLEDHDLPSVPPLSVSIPHDYPDTAPVSDNDVKEFSSTPFFAKVQKALDARLSLMPTKYTLSQLLNAWEMSVRAACSPKNIPVTPGTVVMGV